MAFVDSISYQLLPMWTRTVLYVTQQNLKLNQSEQGEAIRLFF